MSGEPTNPPATVDQSELIPPLRQMFGSDHVTAAEWSQQVPPGTATSWGGGAVTRLAGTAVVDGQSRPWSLIRKQLNSPQDRDQWETPSGILYWKREYHVYQSGLLDGLLDGFAVPHCYHVEMAPDTCTLWLEEIREELPT